MSSPMKCACKHDGSIECWSTRYRGSPYAMTCEEVADDGGPCECACHHEYDRAEALESIGWFG